MGNRGCCVDYRASSADVADSAIEVEDAPPGCPDQRSPDTALSPKAEQRPPDTGPSPLLPPAGPPAEDSVAVGQAITPAAGQQPKVEPEPVASPPGFTAALEQDSPSPAAAEGTLRAESPQVERSAAGVSELATPVLKPREGSAAPWFAGPEQPAEPLEASQPEGLQRFYTAHSSPIGTPDELSENTPADARALGTRLHKAAAAGDTAEIDSLLAANADVHERTKRTGCTPLMLAVDRGHLGAVQLLLERSADPRSRESVRGMSCDMVAARQGGVQVISELLQTADERAVKARLLAADQAGRSGLMLACREGHLEAVTELLERADLSARLLARLQDGEGKSALIYAVSPGSGNSGPIVALLIQAKAGLQADVRGRDPIFYAAFHGQLEGLEALAGAQEGTLEHADKAGYTPIMAAAFSGELRVVRWLIQHGSSVEPELAQFSVCCCKPLKPPLRQAFTRRAVTAH